MNLLVRLRCLIKTYFLFSGSTKVWLLGLQRSPLEVLGLKTGLLGGRPDRTGSIFETSEDLRSEEERCIPPLGTFFWRQFLFFGKN